MENITNSLKKIDLAGLNVKICNYNVYVQRLFTSIAMGLNTNQRKFTHITFLFYGQWPMV